jgi:threonine dehydratase
MSIPFPPIPGFDEPSVATVRAAQARLHGHLHRTPVHHSREFDQLAGAQVHLKCENFQRSGSFKARGAFNTVLSLDDATAARGVAAHSSGNHGAALALAARERGIKATIVVPTTCARAKLDAITRYGGELVFTEPTIQAREAAVAQRVAQTGAVLVHPYDHPAVISGQATAALELLEDKPDLDFILTPISGGGLLGGTLLAVEASGRPVRVYGVEPAGVDDAARSLASGRLEGNATTVTIADGLRGALSARTFELIRPRVAGIVTVTEPEIIAAMRLVWEIFKLIIEPSCAVPVAALLNGRVPDIAGRKIGIIITGGNVDLGELPWGRSPSVKL